MCLGICQNWVSCDVATEVSEQPAGIKLLMSGTLNFSRVVACALRNKQPGRGHRPRLSIVCEIRLSEALRSQHIAIAGNCRCRTEIWSSFPLLICSRSAWPSRLLYLRGRKFRGTYELPYIYICMYYIRINVLRKNHKVPCTKHAIYENINYDFFPVLIILLSTIDISVFKIYIYMS
jgi:hypothetical protein